MRGLPIWILALMTALSALLIVIGWHDRHEAGYLPFVMGIVFAVFTLAAVGGKVQGDDAE
ncbi:MAG: hypothetical protein AB7V42_12970 [Thermoleophilia bacterium]